MRRVPIVVGATVAGLVGILTFHTKSAPLTLVGQSGAPPASRAGSGGASAKTGPSTAVAAPPTTIPSTTRRAIGIAVNYNYGILSVSVTASGKRITKVGIASIDDGGNFRSVSIDQESIPLLEEQAVQAQSAHIQGVSGASYTSAGFEESLQSALGKLGLG